MVAAEFGVVDIEAGQKAEPEKKVTREFAAHTLNYCLGYKLEGDGGYTFSDIADCQSQYQDDAQIAVNRGWFTLVDGKFMPGQDITAAEAEQMLADAASVLKESEVDAGAAGNYTFADDVRVIPEGTDVSIDENDIVTINGTAGADVKEGETFVVYPADFPCLYKAVTVEKSQDTVVITTEEADEDTAIKSVQSEGIADADLSQFESAENMEATYVETKKQARAASSTYGIQVTKDSIIADTKIPLGNGLSVKVAVNLSDLKIPHKIDSMNGYYYVELKGNVAVTGTLSADLIEMGGVSKDVKIWQIRIAGVGVIEVTLHFSAEGRIIVTYSGGFGAGFQSSGGDFRLLTSFKKKSFTSTVEAEASIGLKASAGIDLLIVKGSAYLESGMSWHFEDRRLVMSCTRGKDYSYFTNSLSRYGSSCFGDGSSTGFDEEWKPYTIYTYDLDEDGNATITSYKGNVGVLIIPDTLDGHKVAGIGKGAFKNCILQVVVIPDTVVTIGEEAFAESANLRSVEIGNSVTKIENDAFRRDKKLTEITIPDSVTKMGSGVFGECEGLSRVKLSKSLKGIGAFAFYYCDRLAEIEIPKNLEETKNAYYYFEGGPGYTAGSGPFYGCDGLKTVTFEKGTTKVANGLFAYCPGLESITLPETIETLENEAFLQCTNLKKIEMSDSVKSFGNDVFNGDSSLTDICLPKELPEIPDKTFKDCSALTTLELPETVNRVGTSAFQNSGVKKMEIPLEVTEIGKWAFAGSGLEELIIKDAAASIINSAFRNCASLKSVDLGKNITTIGKYSFENCDLLTSIAIPDSVSEIGEYICANSELLKNVTLGTVMCISISSELT